MKRFKNIVRIILITVILSLSVISVSAKEIDQSVNANKMSNDYVNIVIDGYFDDWKDKPHTKICWPWDPINKYHQGSLFRDDENLYLHIKMDDVSYTGFVGANYIFTIDGKETAVVVVPSKLSSGNSNIKIMEVRSQNGYYLVKDSSAMLNTTKGKAEECEIKIPLKFFCNDIDTINRISFYSPNLGPQCIHSVSSPTLPVVLAAIGFAFACVGYYKSKKKKTKES